MTTEEAKEYSKNMTYRDAIYNAIQGKCIPYRKATLIKMYELLDIFEPTGKWIPIPYELDCQTDAECSLCHGQFIDAIRYNYCPNCGACMKEGRTLDEFIEDSKESEE